MVRKGYRSMKRTFFHKGHPGKYLPEKLDPSEKGAYRYMKRTTQDIQDFVSKNTTNGLIVHNNEAGVPQGLSLPRDADGTAVDITALRSTDQLVRSAEVKQQEHINNDNTYMLLHKEKLCTFWNHAFRCHTRYRKDCKGDLKLNDQLCQKWGLGWEIAVTCTHCQFSSDRMKIFNEVNTGLRGRKSATVNIGLQVGLSKQGISNTGMRQVLAATNIIPPSASAMQKSANRVCEIISFTNEHDMANTCNELQHLNMCIGRSPDHPIPAEADATYNNKIYSGVGVTPFQAGTQATMLVAENLTPNKKIIAAKTYSKLCSCRRPTADSPHSASCTANLPRDASIGNEGFYVTDCINSVNAAGIQIGNLTLDGDSTSRSTVQNIQQPGGAKIKPQYCTRHLSRTMQKHIKKTVFTSTMFPGRTKVDRDQVQNRFAFDLSDRVQAEFDAAIIDCGFDIPKLETKLADITDAIVDCYRGCCQLCTEHSYVCSQEKPWFRKYLDINPDLRRRRAFIRPQSEDLTKLRNMIAIRLGPGAIHKTVTNSTQNKCEAANRGIKKAVPGHITHRRNYSGRVHSAVHSMNHGIGKSTMELCEAASAPISDASLVSQVLKTMDKRMKYQQQYKRSHEYKERRRARVQENFKMYDKKKETQQGYSRYGALEDVVPALYIPPTRLVASLQDHNYPTNRITVTRPFTASPWGKKIKISANNAVLWVFL